ncbi:MAG: serine/threonine protein kinase, partial [Deltaproteobacteria bacterium]
MATQACPACGTLHDVGIYVSGKRIRCRACGIPFTVQRAESLVAARAFRSRHAVIRQPSRPFQPPARSSARQRKAADTTPSGGSLFVPGYQIKEMLGKGGMGRVYRALQVSLDRWVAIKVLNEDLAKHHSFIRRFEKESGALASLNHPNIIAIYDRGCHEGVYYFVMEYVGGPSLRRRMHDGLKVRECVQIMSTLCKAVAHAHRRSVIHRDIKPENVLFTEEGVLKVADFGLANIIAPDGRWELTRTRVSMGTVNYMAPEQRRDAKHVDGRADIYSLGVIFYEMLTGEFPVGRFQPPSRLRPGLDPRLDRIVMRMLESQPSRRPQNADLIAATLDSWLQEAGKPEANRQGAASADSGQSTSPRTSGRPR